MVFFFFFLMGHLAALSSKILYEISPPHIKITFLSLLYIDIYIFLLNRVKLYKYIYFYTYIYTHNTGKNHCWVGISFSPRVNGYQIKYMHTSIENPPSIISSYHIVLTSDCKGKELLPCKFKRFKT